MLTYQNKQVPKKAEINKAELASISGISNQMLLRTLGSGKSEEQDGMSDDLRSKFENFSPTEMENLSSIQNVNADQGQAHELDERLRQRAEASFGYDLSKVQVRESRQASDMGARAFAKGNIIHFAPGEYKPEAGNGQRLIAHELSHVVQQAKGGVKSDSDLLNVNTDSALESSADRFGLHIETGSGEGAALTAGLASLPSMDAAAAPVQGDFGDVRDKLEEFGTAAKKKMGHAGSATVGAFKSAGHATADYAKRKARKTLHHHQQKVDELNEHRGEYENADALKRFIWTAKNPLARMTASLEKGGTAKRKSTRDQEDTLAARLKQERDASSDPSVRDRVIKKEYADTPTAQLAPPTPTTPPATPVPTTPPVPAGPVTSKKEEKYLGRLSEELMLQVLQATRRH